MVDLTTLSPMERKVMAELALGYRVADVATRMARSENTIHTHVARVKKKLGARNAVHTVLLFARQAWLEELGEGT